MYLTYGGIKGVGDYIRSTVSKNKRQKSTVESIAYYSRLSKDELQRAPEFMDELSATDRMKRTIFVCKASPRFSRYGSETDYCLKDAADLTGVSYQKLSSKLNEWENN